MIRVVTLEEFDPAFLQKLCRQLYTSFGVGTEHHGQVRMPPGLNEPFDAEKIMDGLEKIRAYQDDKLLLLTKSRLKDRVLPTGTIPTSGASRYGKDRAIITVHGIKDLEGNLKLISRHALHQVGHLWQLHHCVDPRCSMYLPWTPSFAQGDAIFCTFCRDKSDSKISLAKS